jgi:cytochrome c-type protein NapB
LLLTGVIVFAAVGYLVGISDDVLQHYFDPAAVPSRDVPAAVVGVMPAVNYSEMRRMEARPTGRWELTEDYDRPAAQSRDVTAADAALVASSSAGMPAASYSEMRRMETGPTSRWKPSLERIHSGAEYQRCITCHNPHTAEIAPSDKDKLSSLSTRAARRAFNGAPPVIPHAVERTNDAACYACHGEGGVRVGQHVANRMSHGLLVNCLQCHAAPPPKPFAHLEVVVANTFVGLPAPTSGERAFPGAPPVIPHSTWMRERCLSCHGGVAGWPGLEVTHRWRTNCKQCHALSAQLEPAVVADAINFVSEFDAQQP